MGATHRIRVRLPFNGQAITRLPVERRDAFEAHLREIVADAVGFAADSPDEPPAAGRAGQNPVSRLLAQACGVCRGWCCYKSGDKNAYLAVESIQAYRARNPGVSADEIVKAYLQRIPEETYEGSCVFHGRHGCLLPEPMRSETCGWYMCHALIDLSRRAALDDRPAGPDRLSS